MKTNYSKNIKNIVNNTNNLFADYISLNIRVEYNEQTKELKDYSNMYLIDYSNKNEPETIIARAPAGNNKFNFERIVIFNKMIELFHKNKMTLAISEETIKTIFNNCFYKF